jgi:hypothetical protein
MPIPQLSVHGHKARREDVDLVAVERYTNGEIDLRSALGLTPDLLDSLRRQAHALCKAGKWQACIDVVHALAALGDMDHSDPMLLALCHQALGDPRSAESCLRLAGEILETMNAVVTEAKR